ncbi:ABC transporter substrate-binding protein [Pararhizobium sp. IMCC21322]|uniref:ABC transporter substrate-binding protein n=1 Tax=Pararhizobium sp. IMCC21322 TaxID=3067903 RepID=UPI002740DBB4|nr:ABC transporter substrate-binding protein [Pararhizobium sp. IMCC21322]
MNSKTQLSLISILLVICQFFFVVSSQAQETTPWTIAVVGPMSGDSAQLGRAMVEAAQIRVDEVNADGGVNGRLVELKTYDDENSATKAVLAAKQIALDDNNLLVIGHRTSGASIAAGPIYLENKIPAISGTATADALTVGNPWYFRVTYNNGFQADFIANYINSVLGYKTATLVSTNSVYGRSLAKAFVTATGKLPLEIKREFTVDAKSPDIDLDMADIVSELSLAPDSGMVFLAMNAANAAHFVREMRNSGFTLPIFGPDSINQQFPTYFEPDPILKTRPGDFTDQIYATTSMIWDVANENAVNFRAKFRNKYGHNPDSGNALYYDAASVAIHAIENAEISGTDIIQDRDAIRSFLTSIDKPIEAFDGITGNIYFDDKGNAIKSVPVGIFELGEFISAPIQLQPVLNPVMVPNFSEKLESKDIIPYADGYMNSAQIVYFGVDINEISNLNTATGNYTLDFFIWFRYRGDLDLSKIEFSNAVSPIRLINPIWSRERNSMQIQTFKVRGTFHGDFQFKNYPFDKQNIVLEVRHRDLTSESLRFVTDNLGMRLTGEGVTLLSRLHEEDVFRSAKGWQMTNAQIYQDVVKTASTLGETRSFQGETAVNFSKMKMEMEISRKLTSYSTTIMLPMVILFVIGLLLFAVPIREIPPRLSGGILVLVTVSLLRARLSNDLPNIGYLVAIDYIFFALQIVMWFSIAVSVLVFWVNERKSEVLASRLNIIGASLYPLPIIAVGIYIWWSVSFVG